MEYSSGGIQREEPGGGLGTLGQGGERDENIQDGGLWSEVVKKGRKVKDGGRWLEQGLAEG